MSQNKNYEFLLKLIKNEGYFLTNEKIIKNKIVYQLEIIFKQFSETDEVGLKETLENEHFC